VQEHDGVYVVRDDLFPGGTKARVLHPLFRGTKAVVYATPAQGGAQTSLAHVAHRLGKQAVLFVARRGTLHPRTYAAKKLGALIRQVSPGYLSVVQARARDYAARYKLKLMSFGGNDPEVVELLKQVAVLVAKSGISPDEVWCASGSGVLARALSCAFPFAERHSVQVGCELTSEEVAGAKIHVYPRPFAYAHKTPPPFPSDPHYDSKAWELCLAHKRRRGRVVLFWNVAGPV